MRTTSAVRLIPWEKDVKDTRTVLTEEVLQRLRDDLIARVQNRYSDDEYSEEKQRYLDDQVEALGIVNLSAPTVYVPFESPAWGLAFNVPHNPAWVNATYRLEPYTQVEGHQILEFGPLIYTWHGVSFFRAAGLRVIPARSAEEMLSHAHTSEFLEDSGVSLLHIGPLAAVTFLERPPESPTMRVIEIAGKKYNYVFSSPQFFEEFLKQAAESVHLID